MHDKQIIFLESQFAKYPLRCRLGTSDIDVFHQIFVEREYSCLDDIDRAGLIIDCGANVGYSSAYFLSYFPGSEIVAIEPDPNNFEILNLNLASYKDSARLLRSAVWSHPARLTLSEIPYNDGREWSQQVRECRPGEDLGFLGVNIGDLLSDSNYSRISILKVDIEGAEGVVFSRNYDRWIDFVDNIVIEIHDDSYFGNCSMVFNNAIAGRGFSVARHKELTVCKRSKLE